MRAAAPPARFGSSFRVNEVLFSTTLADMAEDYKSQLERCGKGDEYHVPMVRRPAPKGSYTKRRTINMDKFYADQETEDK